MTFSKHRNGLSITLSVLGAKALGLLGIFTLLPMQSLHAEIRFNVQDRTGHALNQAVLLAEPGPVSPTATPAVMDQLHRQFNPTLLVVPQGQAVVFPNSDQIRHHVYSFSKPKPFEIKLYAGVPEAPIVFEKAGVVVLGCNIHDSMLGYILVTDTPFYAISNEQGRVTLALNQLPHSIRAWHPRLKTGVDNWISVTPQPNSDGSVTITLDVRPAEPTLPQKNLGGFGAPLRVAP